MSQRPNVTPLHELRQRPPNKLVKASVTNEIQQALRARVLPTTGQVVLPGATGGNGGMMPVRCTQTGGSAGNKTTQCSFTYTIKQLDNSTTLATGVAVVGNGNRCLNAAMTAGTYGMAFIDYDGSWKLMFVDEKFTQTNCT